VKKIAQWPSKIAPNVAQAIIVEFETLPSMSKTCPNLKRTVRGKKNRPNIQYSTNRVTLINGSLAR
jgi:hypothetical protein